jgi:putrescine transport system substrate-binding protein
VRRAPPLVLASMALLIGQGCSHPDSHGASAAEAEEKVLNVDNWSDYIQPAVIADFEKQYGIRINYDVFDSNEILETKLLTGHTNYDVVVPSAAFLERQVQADIYQKLNRAWLPNLKNVDPDVERALAKYDGGVQYSVDYM